MKRIFEIDPWKIVTHEFNPEDKRLQESMTSIGNEYMGMRGMFEENYSGDTHQGIYLGGVWYPDKTRVGWWKNGYPEYFGKVRMPSTLSVLTSRSTVNQLTWQRIHSQTLNFA